MAIAYVKGNLARDAYFKQGGEGKVNFAACSLKETYKDRSGEERLGGYHDVVAFGEDALRLGALEKGDHLSVKASIRYRPDQRFVGKQDEDKNPFVTQFVVMEYLDGSGEERLEVQDEEEEDPFGDL